MGSDNGIRNIGSRLELFVDDLLIDKMDGARLQLNEPQFQGIVMEWDQPWEGNSSGPYHAVIRDGEVIRLYYRGSDWVEETQMQSHHPFLCLAESHDGIEWERPKLGLIEFQGSKENNIVSKDWLDPFLDENPAAPESERYKASAGEMDYGFYGYISPDGVNWRRVQDEPFLTADEGYDWTQTAFWDDERKEYAAYLRGWGKLGGGKVKNIKLTPPRKRWRAIRYTKSKDYRHWSDPVMAEIDPPLSPQEQFYTSTISPYYRAPHLLLGFPMRHLPGRHKNPAHNHGGLSDVAFISSRDGHRFERLPEAFIRPGPDIRNWVQRSNYPARGILETAPGEISIYLTGHYMQEGPGVLRRYSIRTDGFVSVNAGYDGGELLTKPLVFKGSKLIINYAGSAYGSLQVEIQDADGKAVEGYRLDQCPVIYGDEIEHAVTWDGGSDVSRLAGEPVRLRFVMRDADLYSLRFIE